MGGFIFRITNYTLFLYLGRIEYWPQFTDHWLLTTVYWKLTTDNWPLTTDPPTTDYWPLPTELLTTAYWPSDHRPLTTVTYETSPLFPPPPPLPRIPTMSGHHAATPVAGRLRWQLHPNDCRKQWNYFSVGEEKATRCQLRKYYRCNTGQLPNHAYREYG